MEGTIEDTGSVELEEYTEEETGQEQGNDTREDAKETKEEKPTSNVTSDASSEEDDSPKPKPKKKEPEAETGEKVRVDASQAELIAKQLGLPPEIKSIVDKNGNLKFVIPMDGKKYLASPAEVVKGFNLNQVGHKRLQQGKQLENQFKEYISSMKQDPTKYWELADKLGHDKYELAHQLLESYVKEQSMTDEEKEAQRIQQEAERLRRENEQFRLEKQRAEHQRQVADHKEKMSSELLEAMKSNGFKPFTPGEDPNDKRVKSTIMANAIGKVMLAQQYNKSLSISDAVYLAKQEWQDNLLSGFADIDDNHIIDIIPERIVNAIRKADIAKLKGATPASGYGQPVELEEYRDSASTKRVGAKKKTGLEDYFQSL